MIKSSFLTMATYVKLLGILSLIFAPTVVAQACTHVMVIGDCMPNDSDLCNDYCQSTWQAHRGDCLTYIDIREVFGPNAVDLDGNEYTENYEEEEEGGEAGGLNFNNFGLTRSQEIYQFPVDDLTYGQLIGDPDPEFWNQVHAGGTSRNRYPNTLAKGEPQVPNKCACCLRLQEAEDEDQP